MIYETARVVKTEGNRAVIAKEPSQMCSGCALSGSCMSSGDVRCDRTYVVLNGIGARRGDRVEIGFSSGRFLVSVLLVYLLPILLMITGIGLGSHVAPAVSGYVGRKVDTTVASIVLGLVFLVGTFIFLHLFNRWCGERGVFQPKIVRIITRLREGSES